jgi:glutamate formiminotransferase / 5-formyltetrahydrofolate cyclo-ligase
MLECVANLSEGRRGDVVERLGRACGAALLDVHLDPDHHRSVFTLAGPGRADAEAAARRLALAAAAALDLSEHAGAHPRIGAIDVVPFVALAGSPPADAVEAARRFAAWITRELKLPALLYGDADPERRSLPEVRKLAATTQVHPLLGAVAVGARPVLVAVNCELDRDDVELARRLAASVRERDGGLPGVRALGFRLASRRRAQVSMNLTALEETGLEGACTEVRDRARLAGADVARVELVGLVPRVELERCSASFREWSELADDVTIEARLARQAAAP